MTIACMHKTIHGSLNSVMEVNTKCVPHVAEESYHVVVECLGVYLCEHLSVSGQTMPGVGGPWSRCRQW